MESCVQLICQVTDGLHSGQGGRQGRCWQLATAATLPFFSQISQKAPVYPQGAVLSCTEVVVLVGEWRTTGLPNTLSPSPRHDKIVLTQEPKLREMKHPQKINLFSILFFYSLFSLFRNFACHLWGRRIREKQEGSHKVFVHIKEEGGKTKQKNKEIKKPEQLFPFFTDRPGALGRMNIFLHILFHWKRSPSAPQCHLQLHTQKVKKKNQVTQKTNIHLL